MRKFIQYIKDVRFEMAKVSWPSRQEVMGATTLVVILSVIISLIIKFFDTVLNFVIGYFLKI